MSNNNTNSNKINVPEARAAMEQFKFEVANEIGVIIRQLSVSGAGCLLWKSTCATL